MPNGYNYSEQRHNGHDYGDDVHRTYDCKFGCGCSMGQSSSHGPLGVDPFGECPGNPIEGKSLGNMTADTDFVVTRRFKELERRCYKAEDTVRRTRPAKKYLAEQNEVKDTEICNLRNKLLQITRIAKIDLEKE
ncbi:MAG: hypothetical protein NTW79_00120 [Candidatus Berkelbacteria bacterium]|nr:hypothetical protein [Candidatus Berkelbacteria bacterium]